MKPFGFNGFLFPVEKRQRSAGLLDPIQALSRAGKDFQHGRGMNISLCCLICLCINGAGIYMIVNARRKLRNLCAD